MRVTTKVIAVEPTTVCTLRCRLCALGVPYLKAPAHEATETVTRELKRLFQVWDYAERIDIGGGEPLAHPQLSDIVSEILKYREHYGVVRIVTNCTLMPGEALWQVIEKHRDTVSFLLDDYGKYSTCFSRIEEGCKARNISYKHNIYHGDHQYCDGWIDFGGWEDRNYSREQLLAVYKNCHTSENPCVTVYGGAAYFCCRSMLGELLGYYETDSVEKIDLLNMEEDLDKQRQNAWNFGKYPPIGCRFCDGFNVNGKRYPAAEQLE